jgi:hypothetical protein
VSRAVPRTLAQEIVVLLHEPGAEGGMLTIGHLSRRLGVSSALTRLCAKQLVADGIVDAYMVDHAGMQTLQGLTLHEPGGKPVKRKPKKVAEPVAD